MAEARKRAAHAGPSLAARLLRVALVIVTALVVTAAIFVRSDIPVHMLRAEYGGAPSRFILIDGMEVHYRDEGPKTGTPLTT